jgi:glycine cleavage system H protein
MPSPQDRLYTREHEWVKVEDQIGTVGITDYAQDQLGDIVYVQLPQVGQQVRHMEPFGEIESVKAVADLYAPVSGEVVEVNGELEDHPELVNQDPYGRGWMIKVRLSDPTELERLMTAQEYDHYIAQEAQA